MKLEANLTVKGKSFKRKGRVTLFPPTSDNYYGSGYYMRVEMEGGSEYSVDVRYEHTTNIYELATRWARGYYGDKASVVTVE